MKRSCTLTVIALAVSVVGGCGGVNLTSRQKDRDITIDGKLSDWAGALESTKKAGLSFGLMNDDSCLYVAVVASDRLVRQQIMISGLYLWFDETGEKNKNFGICFPVGGLETGDSGMRPQGLEDGAGGRRPMPPGGPDSLRSPLRPTLGPGMRPPTTGADSVTAPFPMVPREMMVYSPRSDSWDPGKKGSLGGVDVAADLGRRALVLEFRIPLERDPSTGYGIGVRAGQTVGVGIESPEIKGGDAENRDRPPEGGFGGPGGGGPGGPSGADGNGPSGGMGGGPGGSGGPGGMGGPGGEGGDQPKRPETIKVWGKLTLAGGGSIHPNRP